MKKISIILWLSLYCCSCFCIASDHTITTEQLDQQVAENNLFRWSKLLKHIAHYNAEKLRTQKLSALDIDDQDIKSTLILLNERCMDSQYDQSPCSQKDLEELAYLMSGLAQQKERYQRERLKTQISSGIATYIISSLTYEYHLWSTSLTEVVPPKQHFWNERRLFQFFQKLKKKPQEPAIPGIQQYWQNNWLGIISRALTLYPLISGVVSHFAPPLFGVYPPDLNAKFTSSMIPTESENTLEPEFLDMKLCASIERATLALEVYSTEYAPFFKEAIWNLLTRLLKSKGQTANRLKFEKEFKLQKKQFVQGLFEIIRDDTPPESKPDSNDLYTFRNTLNGQPVRMAFEKMKKEGAPQKNTPSEQEITHQCVLIVLKNDAGKPFHYIESCDIPDRPGHLLIRFNGEKEWFETHLFVALFQRDVLQAGINKPTEEVYSRPLPVVWQ